MMKNFNKFLLFIVLLNFADNVLAQQSDFQLIKQKGVDLYKQGNFKDAINSLKSIVKRKEAAADAEIWNFLGLAYLEQNRMKDARKSIEKAVTIAPQNASFRSNLAFVYLIERKIDKAQSEIEKAIQIEPNNANAYYIRGTANSWEGKFDESLQDAEKAISVNSKFSPAYVLKSDLFTRNFGNAWISKSPPEDYIKWLAQAEKILEECAKTCAKDENYKAVEEKRNTVQAFYKYFKKKADSGFNAVAAEEPTNDPNRTPLRILSKPRANYTDRARYSGRQGVIILAVVFADDGNIKNILLLKGLGYGLDQEAFKAASQIKFQPETENGKPVSVVKMVQYSFEIY